MRYKVGDIVEMKILTPTIEGPHYTARMREVFINNPEVKIVDIVDGDIREYYVKDYRNSSWRILEKWIVGGEIRISYFIS